MSFSNSTGIVLTITKDAAGETVVIAVNNFDATENAASYATLKVRVASPSSPAAGKIDVPNHGTSDGMTVLTPFVVPKAMPSFTPSVSILTYSQHVSGAGSATLDIDGTDYLSTGLWAVKDAPNSSSGGAELSGYVLRAELTGEANVRAAADNALRESIEALTQKYVDLTSGTDLNTVAETGSYRCTSDLAETLLNMPEDVGSSGFSLDVFSPSDSCIAQHIVWCTALKVHSIIRCGTPADDTVQWGEWSPFKVSAEGGDEIKAQLNALIDRSITEIESDAESVGNNSFRYCTALTGVVFTVAEIVGEWAFRQCVSLVSADFSAASSVGSNAFDTCSSLTALALRNNAVASLASKNALASTPIESGTGYIYVPAALVDTYKAATNWSNFASQFRALEDYTVDGTTTGVLDPSKI